MGDIFAGTGVKRYYAQHRRGLNDWEHPMAGYDTLEAARVDLAGFPLPGEYRIVEMIPFVNYAPGVYVKSRLLDNILEAGGFKPYALQRLSERGEWETQYGWMYDTLEEAQARERPGVRAAAAVLRARYKPVKVVE